MCLFFFLVGIPTAYYFGQEGLHNILVIDLLGPSLEDMFDTCGRHFSVKTTAMLAKQMVYTHIKFKPSHLLTMYLLLVDSSTNDPRKKSYLQRY